MKSEHRHDLETNTLARYLSRWIDSGKPYAQVAALAALAVVAAIVLWAWFGRLSTGRNVQAWQAYNEAVEGPQPSLDLLLQAAEEFPDSPPGELADVTWADGQVFHATNAYLVSKQASEEAMKAAVEKYENMIQTSGNANLVSRAHFGLGRAYELQADLENARAEYKQVTGPFEPMAKQSLARLDANQAEASLQWLAKAEMTRPTMPFGPGTPGVRPEFKPDELTTPEGVPDVAPSFEDILKRLDEAQQQTGERYAPPGEQPPPGVTEGTPPSDPQPPTEEQPPTVEQPPTLEEPAAEKP